MRQPRLRTIMIATGAPDHQCTQTFPIAVPGGGSAAHCSRGNTAPLLPSAYLIRGSHPGALAAVQWPARPGTSGQDELPVTTIRARGLTAPAGGRGARAGDPQARPGPPGPALGLAGKEGSSREQASRRWLSPDA
jgi:hypothetical protein